MPSRFRQWLPRAIACLAAILAALLALGELKETRDYGPYLTLSSLIRRQEPLSDRAVTHYAQSLDLPLGTCRTDILNAVVSVAEHEAHRQSVGNRDGWPTALQRWEQVVRNALACNPTNGDLWIRLAGARWFSGGSADEQIALLTLSQTYSPANLDTIRKRLAHWAMVTRPMAALGEDLIRRDVRTMLLYAPEKDAVSSLDGLPDYLRPLVRSEEAIVSAPRLEKLKAAGLSTDGV
jgi:hypothetical protein